MVSRSPRAAASANSWTRRFSVTTCRARLSGTPVSLLRSSKLASRSDASFKIRAASAHSRKRNGAPFERPAVEQDRGAGVPVDGNELIHDAAGNAHKIGFGNVRHWRE